MDAVNHLAIGLQKYFTPRQLALLQKTKIGIAGAGGLGSNTATLLARSGIQKMTLIDFDIVEPANLNRQMYWPRHIGRKKTEALAEILLELNPNLELELLPIRITEANLHEILPKAEIWVEAFDNAQIKSAFTQQAVLTAKLVVAASGICGYGGEPLAKKRLGHLHIVGDFQTDANMIAPYAPKVNQAAALMADSILEYILSDS